MLKGAPRRAPFLLFGLAVLIAGASLVLLSLRPERRPAEIKGSKPGPRVSLPRSPLADCETTADASLLNEGGVVEPHLAADPRAPDRLVVAWQQDRWSDGAAKGIVTAASLDGGASWRLSADTGSTECSGGVFERATDPWVAFDEEGRVHLAYLSVDTDPRAAFGISPDAVVVVTSEDGGLEWSEPVELALNEDPKKRNDKPTVTALGESAYATWTTLDRSGDEIRGTSNAAFSIDGGRTWSEPVVVYRPPTGTTTLGEQIAPISETELVLVFSEITVDPETALESVVLKAVRSGDGGRTWGSPITISTQTPGATLDPFTGAEIVGGRLLPDVAVDHREGRVYVAWLEQMEGGYDRVAISFSEDSGHTWSEPSSVGSDLDDLPPLQRQALLPSVHVLRDGTVGVAFLDMRRNVEDLAPTDPLEVDLFVAVCDDPRCGSTTEKRVTEDPLDLRGAPVTSGPFVGDYFGFGGIDRFELAYVDPGDGAAVSSIVHAWIEP